jgi:integrase
VCLLSHRSRLTRRRQASLVHLSGAAALLDARQREDSRIRGASLRGRVDAYLSRRHASRLRRSVGARCHAECVTIHGPCRCCVGRTRLWDRRELLTVSRPWPTSAGSARGIWVRTMRTSGSVIGAIARCGPKNREDARVILAQAAQVRNGARWSVAFGLGLRQCEALGLRWRYVDLEQEVARIFQLKRRRFQHGCDDPHLCGKKYHNKTCPDKCARHGRYCHQRTGGDWVFREPKSGKTRLLPIPSPLIPGLNVHKAAQAAERLAAGDQWEDWDLVFVRPDGRPIETRDDWEQWRTLLNAAGVRGARPHDARHTAATLLLEQGVDIRVVQEILGHSSLAVTKHYTHVTSKLSRDAADRMGEALWG